MFDCGQVFFFHNRLRELSETVSTKIQNSAYGRLISNFSKNCTIHRISINHLKLRGSVCVYMMNGEPVSRRNNHLPRLPDFEGDWYRKKELDLRRLAAIKNALRVYSMLGRIYSLIRNVFIYNYGGGGAIKNDPNTSLETIFFFTFRQLFII